ncbi:glucan-binding protein, partial [Bacillus cereus]
MKKVILPVLMSAMVIVPAVSHAEKQDNVKQTTAKAEQTIQQSGWVKVGDTWYFYDQKGMKKTGWLQDGGKWYYFDGNGKMQTGHIVYQ